MKFTINSTVIENNTYWIDTIDFDQEGLGLIVQLHARYASRAKRVFSGRNRNCFDMGSYVVKIPKNLDGFCDNDWEGSVSNGNDDPNVVRYARTRMHYVDEIPVVFMEWVEHATGKKITEQIGYEPDWVMSVDCGQVGFTKDGRLVAYDYGCR